MISDIGTSRSHDQRIARRVWAVLSWVLLLTVVTACSDDSDNPEEAAQEESLQREPDLIDPALRGELLGMRDADQAERTGESTANGDHARAERLSQILDEYGWPTPELVGEDGVSAAWLIAQHADFDVEFQERVLELMTTAVAAGTADPTEMAFLEDRIAVNRGQPQTYGSQIRCFEGNPEPATPIVDPEQLDQRREAVGLGPIEDYMAELAEACAAES